MFLDDDDGASKSQIRAHYDQPQECMRVFVFAECMRVRVRPFICSLTH